MDKDSVILLSKRLRRITLARDYLKIIRQCRKWIVGNEVEVIRLVGQREYLDLGRTR